MQKLCLFCKQGDIEVEMMIKTDSSQTATVYLCSTHANLGMAAIKKGYAKKLKEIEQIKELAKLHGLSVIDPSETQPPQPQAQPRLQPQQPQPPQTGQKVLYRKPSDQGEMQQKAATANVPESEEAPRIASHQIDGKAPKILSKEDKVIERSDGLPIKVPEKIVSEAGITHISIVNTGGDAEIQRRTKEMAKSLDIEVGASTRPSKGYSVKDCAICRGSGKVMNNQMCPRCKGSGLMT